MKLRQKLAVVLASAMVVTAVPVVTMAQATTTLKREVITIKKDDSFMTVSTANAVKVTFDNDEIDGTDIIYLTLENAEWNTNALDAEFGDDAGTNEWSFAATGSASATGTITYQKQTDKVMKVTFDGHASSSTVYLPLLAKATGGDAKVTVENKGYGSLSKTSSYIFATTGEKKFTYKLDDPKVFYRDGELTKLTLEETYPGSLAAGGTFRLELDDTDYRFVEDMEITAKGLYGFGGTTKTLTYKIDPDNKKDTAAILITIPAMASDKTLGMLEITGIEVKTSNKTPEEGDFLVDLKSDDAIDAKNNLVMGKVTKYGTYIKMKDEKAKEIKAGRIEEIEFEVGEGVEDSMISDREFELTLDKAHFDYKSLLADAIAATDGMSDAYDNMTTAEKDKLNDKQKAAYIDPAWLAEKICDNDDNWVFGNGQRETNAAFDVNSDGEVIPETIIVYVGYSQKGNKGATQSNEHADVMKFKIKTCVPVDKKDDEKVTITASGRALENEVSTQAVAIVNPFNVTYEQSVLKTGLQAQVSGSVTITETDKDMLQKGTLTFKVKKDNEYFGIYLTDATAETSAGIKGSKVDIKKGSASGTASMNLNLNRSTKEAGVITFKDMTFTTDRTVPEGTYDLEISGTAVDQDGHTITVKDFIKITTTNTQDITSNGLAKGTSTFVIGESKYTFEGKEYTMDAPSYIQDPGFTMVPVRYVAQAFGVAEKDIVFGKGTVTIFAGERTISLTNGSNTALVNGNPIAMGTAVVIKDGRTYAPASQIASLLGMKSTWDAASKTATFENK